MGEEGGREREAASFRFHEWLPDRVDALCETGGSVVLVPLDGRVSLWSMACTLGIALQAARRRDGAPTTLAERKEKKKKEDPSTIAIPSLIVTGSHARLCSHASPTSIRSPVTPLRYSHNLRIPRSSRPVPGVLSSSSAFDGLGGAFGVEVGAAWRSVRTARGRAALVGAISPGATGAVARDGVGDEGDRSAGSGAAGGCCVALG